MNISIVIPNYNGEKLIKENLPRVFEAVKINKKGSIDIVVADDGSSDNSIAILKNMQKVFFKEIPLTIVESKFNRGFSSNVNSGVKAAKGEVIILLNTDVIPEKDFLNYLIPHFQDKNIFAVGCLDKSVENNSIVLRGNGTGQWKKGFLIHKAGELSKEETLWASGGSSAFRKELWEKLGGLNELYNPFYWEDIDISYRAWKAGFKVLFEQKSIVRHEHEKGAIKTYNKELKIKIISYKNQFLFVWLNITDIKYLLSHIAWLPFHIINSVLNGELAFVIGFLTALVKLPECLYFRSKNVQLWRMSDREVFNKFL